MTLKVGEKAGLLIMGFIFVWLALFLMLSSFYEGLVEATIEAAYDGYYRPSFLSGESVAPWIICMLGSSVCLAIGFGAEESESKAS